jgi:RimJ/RimL family protein N-acetyltransferase
MEFMSWIRHPLILEGKHVLLLPLEEGHFEELINSSQDEAIWTYMPVMGTDKDKLRAMLEEALVLKDKGDQYPFVVIERSSQKIIGCTSFLKLNKEHSSLEIGRTWYLPQYWGNGYNSECKLLLLTYCFETLKTIRVQIVANEKNARSRAAIEKIGATFEGVLRNMVIRMGHKRNTAFYSIIDEEWETVKQHLTQRLNAKIN